MKEEKNSDGLRHCMSVAQLQLDVLKDYPVPFAFLRELLEKMKKDAKDN